MNDLEEEAIGPGADLAISLTGVLIALLVGSFFYWENLANSKSQIMELLRLEQSNLETTSADLVAARAALEELNSLLNTETQQSSILDMQLSDAQSKLTDLSTAIKARDKLAREVGLMRSEHSHMAQVNVDLEVIVADLKARLELTENELIEAQLAQGEQSKFVLQKYIQELEQENLSDQPPFININDAWRQLFDVGSATLDPEFKYLLETKIANEIANLTKDYDAQVIEVVGHTDELPVTKGQVDHIDLNLLAVLNRNANLKEIVPRSNMDLGMARAVAVALVLGDDPKLSTLTIRPMSAGQTTLPNEKIAPYSNGAASLDDAERRRIEIRVRRRSETQIIK